MEPRTPRPHHIALFLAACLACAVLLVCVAASGCGGAQRAAADRAPTMLATTLEAVDAASKGFLAWDEAHQTVIAETATSAADYQAKITAYRRQREEVVAALTAAYGAIAAAATAVALLDQPGGHVDQVVLVAALADVASAVAELERAISAIRTGGSP